MNYTKPPPCTFSEQVNEYNKKQANLEESYLIFFVESTLKD